MRRDTNKASVAWAAKLDADTYGAFQKIFPVKGTFSSIITLGLEAFLNRIENEPMLQVWAHEAIAEHLHNETKPVKCRDLDIRIPTSLYERFNKVLPEWGATSWFVRRLVSTMVMQDTQPLEEQVTTAIEQLLQARVA